MASTSSTSTVNEINTIITTTTATVVDPNPIPPTGPNAAISTTDVIPSTDTKGKVTAEPETIATENSALTTVKAPSSSDSSDTNCNGGVVAEGVKKVAARCIGRRNRGVSWGYDLEQGNRSTMEDALGVFPEFMQLCCKDFGGCTAPECKYSLEKSPVHFFGLFDGHGGDQGTELSAMPGDREALRLTRDFHTRQNTVTSFVLQWNRAFGSYDSLGPSKNHH
ncbi:phosphatase 2C (PP2C)-like protein [Corchorus capsularis]|uniref:Phosphatase 2C (PP2C)-like protein n=1 Tax=Corchorus capsularis TaxID=210143 RepID=A0A1R3HL05_COCAP|nr:phosphatase 2C (PP2C)-like protein [Corchorus capsularis]